MSRTLFAAPLVAGSLLLATAAPSSATPNQVGGLGGEVVGAGVALGAYDFPIDAGRAFTVERYSLKPGEVIRWGSKPRTVVVIPTGGDLVHFPSCSQQYPMANGQSNWVPLSKEAGTLASVTANQTDVPVEVVAVISDVAGVPQRPDQMHREGGEGPPEPDPQPADGCPTGAAAQPVETVTGTATAGARINTIDHDQVAVYRYSLPAGTSTGWHFVPDQGLMLPVRGTVDVRPDCGAGTPLQPGQAKLTAADGDPQLVANDGSDAAEYLLVVFSIPNPWPANVPDVVPGPPPSDCPETLLD